MSDSAGTQAEGVNTGKEVGKDGGDDGGPSKVRTRVSMEYKEPLKRGKNKNNAGGAIEPSTIRFKTAFRNTVYDVMVGRGWKLTDHDMDWDLYWCERDWIIELFDVVHLEHWQRVSHFRNDRELCRKDLLIKNVKRYRRQLEKAKKLEEAEKWNFCPTTFVLPGEYALFVETFKKSSNSTWIMKPIGSAQGKGIFLFRNLKEINRWRSETRWRAENPDVEAYVVQRYVNNPFLVGGKKFDIRLYALVSSFTPLTVWLYRGGFARFSATKYSVASSDNLSNNQMHLTNVAVQKHADNYDDEYGNKWSLRDLKLYLISRFGVQAVDKLFREIQDIVLRSLMSVENVMINDKHCIELYGYDILFDDNLKPWLIEVNASPSLTSNTREDYNMKYSMLNDMFDIIDMEKHRTGEEVTVGGFDLIKKGNQALRDPEGKNIYTTFLGCDAPETDFEPALERHRKAALANPIGRKNSVGKAKPNTGEEVTAKSERSN